MAVTWCNRGRIFQRDYHYQRSGPSPGFEAQNYIHRVNAFLIILLLMEGGLKVIPSARNELHIKPAPNDPCVAQSIPILNSNWQAHPCCAFSGNKKDAKFNVIDSLWFLFSTVPAFCVWQSQITSKGKDSLHEAVRVKPELHLDTTSCWDT